MENAHEIRHNDMVYIGGRTFLIHTTNQGRNARQVKDSDTVRVICLGRASAVADDNLEEFNAFGLRGWQHQGNLNHRVKTIGLRALKSLLGNGRCIYLGNLDKLTEDMTITVRRRMGV